MNGADKAAQLYYGLSDAEIAEMIRAQSPEWQAEKKQQEIEAGTSRVERLKDLVRGTLRREAEQREDEAQAVAQMTPEQQHRHFAKQDPAMVVAMARDAHRPKYWGMAFADIRSEEIKAANAEREQREADAGVPELQARIPGIQGARASAVAEAREVCRVAEQTALDLEREQLADVEAAIEAVRAQIKPETVKV
jgi:hypothetical protein